MNKELQEKGFVVVRNFFNEKNCADVYEYLQWIRDIGFRYSDHMCPNSLAFPDTPLLDEYMEFYQHDVEEVVHQPVLPTYSYARLYAHGDDLKMHQDRPACEISVTICLNKTEDWCFYVFKPSKEDQENHVVRDSAKVAVELEEGDALVYLGTEVVHWREKYAGKEHAQAFFHYVLEEGKHSALQFDGRPYLSHKNPMGYQPRITLRPPNQ